MGNWLLVSLVLSVGLTVLLNVVPRLFPNASRKTEAKLEQRLRQATDQHSGSPTDRNSGMTRPTSGVKVFFPWKAMLIGSVLLTVLLNAGRFFG